MRIIFLALYDDFQNLFGEIEEELVTSTLEDDAERQLLRYVYFMKRYIEALDKENRLTVINNRQQKIVTNSRMNQKYLELAERRYKKVPYLHLVTVKKESGSAGRWYSQARSGDVRH